MSASKVATLPFAHLPNLPRAVIPKVELEVDPVNWDAVRLQVDGSRESQQRVRTFTADRPTQTEETELGEVKEVARVLDELLQSVCNLRKDLNFAQSVMKAEYESKLMQRAIELHHSASTRIADIEKEHKEKLEKVRKSYHTLLNNAVKRICAEYKDYYEDLLSGKTDRHDLIIKRLKERVIELETLTQEQENTILSLNQQVSALEKEKLAAAASTVIRTPSPVTPPPVTGISEEEAEGLRLTISELKDELSSTRVNLGRAETNNAKLSQQVKELVKDVEDERRRAQQLKKDLDVSRAKARAEKEKAEAMAKDQKDALEKQMKDQMTKMMEESKRKADREAELQRMRDQAKDEQERARRKALEEQLARERENAVVEPVKDTGLLSELERLRKVESYQKKEIARLQAEVDSAGKTSELKLAIMQKNFHAFKDEAFIRRNLQRQAAQLHHATVAYASDGSVPVSSLSPGLKSRPLPKIPGAGQGPFQDDYYAFSVHKPLPDVAEESSQALPQAPSPSPSHMRQRVAYSLAVHGSRPGTRENISEEPHHHMDHSGPT